MEFYGTPVVGSYLIKTKSIQDDRGYFFRAFCNKEFRDKGIEFTPLQANLAGSRLSGTLRGMHYQIAPYEEAKLIRCIKGSVFDVVLDIRPESNTFGKWHGVELTASNCHMLYVPPGCAHGYLTLVNDTEVYYLVSQYYSPEAERGILWNDPSFSVVWPIKDNLILSDKDRSWPLFNGD